MSGKNKNRKLRAIILLLAVVTVAVVCTVSAVLIYGSCSGDGCVPTGNGNQPTVKHIGDIPVPDYVTVDYIDPSRARTTDPLKKVNNIVIHYIGNAGTTAKQNRNYFDKPDTLVCAHFIVGLDGEILQCIPLNEQSAASNHRNVDTISVEVCHPDESGKFNDQTYSSLVKLTAWLCSNAGLDENDLIRHHDITGKECPKYFVDFPEEWESFKNDVKQQIK